MYLFGYHGTTCCETQNVYGTFCNNVEFNGEIFLELEVKYGEIWVDMQLLKVGSHEPEHSAYNQCLMYPSH